MLLSSLSNTYFFYFVIQYIGDKMLNLVEPYIEKISKEDINNFALKNNIRLNGNELDFIFNFIKTRYKEVLSNPNSFTLTKYKNNFSNENFVKINGLVNRYKMLL